MKNEIILIKENFFFKYKIQPGSEFETERYLITVEESNNDEHQSCPRPSFIVNDPTMKNKPKAAVCMRVIFNNFV